MAKKVNDGEDDFDSYNGFNHNIIYYDYASFHREHQSKTLNDLKKPRPGISENYANDHYKNKPYKTEKDHPLTRDYLIKTIERCETNNNWAALLNLLETVFSSKNNLSKSFLIGSDLELCRSNDQSSSYKLNDIYEKADAETSEKDPDCLSFISPYDYFSVDIKSVREAFKTLFSLSDVDFFSGIKKGVNQLLQCLRRSRKIYDNFKPHEIMNIIIILFEIPYVVDPIKFEDILPEVCEIVALLPIQARSVLTEIMAKIMKEECRLINLHQILQQRITLRLLTTEYDVTYVLNEDSEIINTVYILQCVYYASILAGIVDSCEQLEKERVYGEKYIMNIIDNNFENEKDDMSQILSIHSMDCRFPLIPYSDFINETLNEYIKIESDYVCFKSRKEFTFIKFSFLLNTQTKVTHLFYDNRIRMRCDNISYPYMSSLMTSSFKITIDRDNLVDDALNALEKTILRERKNLKKRLYIEFKNEETIDEGGVSKEFFQLIIEKIFNPDYGMFIYSEETNMFWFNPIVVEDMSREFRLIGIIVGLAIYNNVILDLKLPPVLYRKLMGKLGNFEDLKTTHPSLAWGLLGLLECEESTVTSAIDQTFQISIKDSFGNIVVKNLKENGSDITLTSDNREEFVQLYSDFLLNESIKEQFDAFYEGFQMVVDESPLKLLFRPDEIELVICGCKNFDFHQLEKVAKYDGGYTCNSSTVKNFWKLIHAMTSEQHSQLLQFATGSDRIPVGGMQNMGFVIIRNGPDTNRLPTAQTCFNSLLLPDYSSEEKLSNCLLKAITYSKGFGIR